MPIPRPLLLFFDPFLPARTGPYRLDFMDLLDDVLKSLRETGKDEIFLNVPNAQGRISKADLILHLPSSYGNVRMVPNAAAPMGRAMTADELALYRTPPMFKTIGWTHADFDGAQLGVELVRA